MIFLFFIFIKVDILTLKIPTKYYTTKYCKFLMFREQERDLTEFQQ